MACIANPNSLFKLDKKSGTTLNEEVASSPLLNEKVASFTVSNQNVTN